MQRLLIPRNRCERVEMKGLRDSPQAGESSPHDNGLDTPANRVPNELAQGEGKEAHARRRGGRE